MRFSVGGASSAGQSLLSADIATSAFVGLAIIVILLPAPGKMSSLIHDAEVERMKRVSLRPLFLGVHLNAHPQTDARVQTITEGKREIGRNRVQVMLNCMVAMHVVRMIKFFAWEKRIENQLVEKRNDELTWIKRSKLLTVVNDNIKCVHSKLLNPHDMLTWL